MPIAPVANGINYITRGDPENPPFLFIAGLGGGISSWNLLLRTYNFSNPRPLYLVAYDPRGLYKSGETTDYGLQEMVEDAHDLLACLHIPRAHILGWSLGGIVAQGYAYTYPETVDKLVLLSTAPMSPDAPELAEYNRLVRERLPMPAGPTPAIYEALMKAIIGYSFNNRMLAWLLGKAARSAGLQAAAYYKNLAQQWREIGGLDSYPQLDNIRAPTLVAHGSADRILPLLGQDLIYDKLTCPKTKVIIPGACHACGIENFLKVNAAIQAFLG
jgi:pimeloyl-ACP methyl ester carboxylesterase